MKKSFFLFIIYMGLILIIGIQSCWMDNYYNITLNNKSEHSIGFYFACCHINDGTEDTTLPITNRYIVNQLESGKKYYEGNTVPWEVQLNELPDSTLHVFIFHTDTLKKYSWEEIRAGYKILKRYDLRISDLQQNNWTIVYP